MNAGCNMPSEVFYFYAARAARGFGDGFAAIILSAYLIELGFNPFQIGIVATAALLGSAAMTLAIGFLAPRYDLRTLLLICAFLMFVTGIAIPSFPHLVFIAAIAFIGTMNPTTGDIGVHVPLEHAALALRASDADRTNVFARYSLIGALSLAAGALAAGTPDLLVPLGVGRIGALQAMFYVYAALGLIGAAFYSCLPRTRSKEATPKTAALGPSRGTVYKLAASLCLILAAFSPNLAIVLGLLLVRSALSQMDVPTRTSYVMAVVTPAERTAAASVTAVPRSLASSISPALAGAFLTTSFAGLPFVICGVLKIVYDLALLYSFRHIKPPEEEARSKS